MSLNTNTLTITIGLPRSGKSTWTQEWAKHPNRVVLRFDDFRHVITGQRFFSGAEDHVRSAVFTAAKALLKAGYDVLLDDTFTSEVNIERACFIHPFVYAVVFTTPIEVCKERAISTNQSDLILPIERMNNNLQNTLIKIKEGKFNFVDVFYQPYPIGYKKIKDLEVGEKFRGLTGGLYQQYPLNNHVNIFMKDNLYMATNAVFVSPHVCAGDTIQLDEDALVEVLT